jgi:pimeloyl-ACP methyl ester carboxylesterase
MSSTTTDLLKVPGAALYYEVRGSGPVLLMIPGGPADADIFAGVVPHLTGDYTVVTYDPRGISRSELHGPVGDWSANVHADDASRLLAAVGGGPVNVFGSSGGALIGLALAVRHPEQVHTLVAHEPPATELLPDRERHRANALDIYETYKREGVGPAMRKFLAGAGLKGNAPPPSVPTPKQQQAMARMARNVELFLAHGMRGSYEPDIAALRLGSPRIIVAGGTESRGQLAYEATVVLAQRLGTSVVDFPGDHGGFMTHPAAFAQQLHAVLASLATS